MHLFDGKSVLITGGTGSFGQVFVRFALDESEAKRIVIFSRDELKQWEMAQQFEGNPRLRGVANFAVGFDNIDVPVATELGIPVSNTPGVLTDTTADLTWALLLSTATTREKSRANCSAQ